MKDKFFFRHDCNASQDPKILNMVSKLTWSSYAIFWLILEKLTEAGGKLLITDLEGLAFAWQVDKQMLSNIINNYNLFEKDDKYFWSSRLLEDLLKMEEVSKKRAEAGHFGGIANAKQMLSKCEANKVKKNKVKKEELSNATNVAVVEPNWLSDKETEWNSNDFIEILIKHKRKDLNIIGVYWGVKGFSFENKYQASEAIKRELRPARALLGYSCEDITHCAKYLEENADFKWTLETISKYINEPKVKYYGKN